MATAEFKSEEIIKAADRRINELEFEREKIAERWIANRMKETVYEGWWPWGSERNVTRQEAEKSYDNKRDYGSHKYWKEYIQRERIKRIKPIKDLAMAANGMVRLTQDECELLGLAK